ncbi:hypothetical protein GCM10027411_25910 [Microbacterium aureliae]
MAITLNAVMAPVTLSVLLRRMSTSVPRTQRILPPRSERWGERKNRVAGSPRGLTCVRALFRGSPDRVAIVAPSRLSTPSVRAGVPGEGASMTLSLFRPLNPRAREHVRLAERDPR